MELLSNPEIWVALLTLTALEIVLGIDNIVFISILANKLPEDQRDRARRVGILAAMGMRILLLLGISWVVTLTEPLFTLFGHELSGRDLILIGGVDPDRFHSRVPPLELATRKGLSPISINRVTAPGASLVWMVDSTRCPVIAAWKAILDVSRSRISPTRMTSGSCLRK